MDLQRLSVALKRCDEVGETGWNSLCNLGLEELHIVGDNHVMPRSAARALLERGSVKRLYLEGVVLDRETADMLLRTLSLESVILERFGNVGEVVIKEHPKLQRIQLLGTRLTSAHLEDLPHLTLARLDHTPQITLRGLPSLRSFQLPGFTVPLQVEINDCSALEHLSACESALGAWTLEDLPALRRIDLSRVIGELDDHVVNLAQSVCQEVLLTPQQPARKKGRPEKRKLTARQWSHPMMGWDGQPRALVLAGRMLSEGTGTTKVKNIAVACEVWSQMSGVHIAAAVPVDALSPLVTSGPLGPVFVGEVLAQVDIDRPTSSWTLDDAAEIVKRIDSSLPPLFEEVSLHVGHVELEGSSTEFYLLVTGPQPRAELVHGDQRISWVDFDAVSWVRLEPSSMEGLPLELRLLKAASETKSI